MAKQSRPKAKASRPSRKKPQPLASALAKKTVAVPAPVLVAGDGRPQSARVGPPSRKPEYYQAVSIYETGVMALQKHDFEGAANQFRQVINRYPEERELHERSVLFLRVCERETAKRSPAPQTAQERVYAATVALNAGDHAVALEHLRRALADSPDSDGAHYIMAVALVSQGQSPEAIAHLRRSIELNPDNRALALQDPDLDDVREAEGFREAVELPAGAQRVRPRRRR
jgi:tetratricopeptide (TPR) repeat protein